MAPVGDAPVDSVAAEVEADGEVYTMHCPPQEWRSRPSLSRGKRGTRRS